MERARNRASAAGFLVGALVASSIVVASPAAASAPVVVSLTFNDASVGQYRYALPLLESAGMRASFYVATNWVDKSFANTMKWWQIDDLYRAGNEIGGMGRDHKNLTLTYEQDPEADTAYKTAQVCDDRQRLVEQGYDPRTFAYPAGAFNAAAKTIVSGCGYQAARAAGGLSTAGPVYAESLPPRDALAIRTYSGPSSAITLQQLQDSVTAAAANGGGWAPLTFNQVCRQGTAGFDSCMGSFRPVDDQVLGQFLDWLSRAGQADGAPAGTAVQTVREALQLPAQTVLPTRPVTVSLTFDDGAASHYRTLEPLASRGMQATYYLNTGDMRMTWQQIANLAASGADIGGHTIDHVDLTDPSMSYASKVEQVCEDRRAIVARGYPTVSFAYAFAAYDSTAIGIVRQCGYVSARRAGGINPALETYAETIPPSNPYTIRTVYREATTALTLADLTGAVNTAAEHGGGWVPLVFHEVCDANQPGYATCMNSYKAIDVATFSAFLDWLRNESPAGTTVKTVAQVMGSGVTFPRVTVEDPQHGAGVTTGTPTIRGSAADDGGQVTVAVYAGSYATGTPVGTATADVTAGSWSVTPSAPLTDGTYTVQATQQRSGAVGRSVPVTFTVAVTSDTTAPAVTIDSPVTGSTLAAEPLEISGSAGTAAGDDGTVLITVHTGTDTSGSPVETASIPVGTDGAWTAMTKDLAEGTYTLSAQQTDSAGNVGVSSPVTVTLDDASSFTVTSVSPGTVSAGSTDITLAVSGTGLPPDSAVSVGGEGVSVGVTAWRDPGLLEAVVDVHDGAATGARDVVVTSGANTAVCVACLVIEAGPRPTALSPSTLGQGAHTVTVNVAGSGFDDSSSVVVSGTGIEAVVVARQPTQLTLSVSAAADAATGPRDVVVQNANGSAGTCAGCLVVVQGPRIDSVSPRTVPRRKNTTVTLLGAHFDNEMLVSVSGSGVSIGTVKRVSATELTVALKVLPTAPVGPRSITVTSRSTFGSHTLTDALEVT
jgi:peptidoglycan/xylan/chitin deacetylase (PgdA/CDA1 family)